MKWLAGALFALVALLQYRLWFGESNLPEVWALQAEIRRQTEDNLRLREEHRVLAAEVNALKHSPEAIEARARLDLGLIKQGETFFMVAEPYAKR